jgi:tyrocidine synthetase-3
VEERLAKIWAEVLGVEKVGVNDNFFEIGGNSIKLITLAYKINQEFGGERESEMKVIELFRLTTISQLAEYFGRSGEKEIQEYTL